MLTILAPLLLSAPQVSESWTATGPIGEPFGQVVASAGHRAWEIARQEILVGSPLQDGAGQLTILSPFGSTSLFFEGPIPGSLLGYAVADAGDLDGDGLAEFFVSAPGMRRSGVDSGMVAAMSSLSRQPLWIRSGQQAGWLWGESLGSIGDLDGDSHREMMVASTYVDAVGTRAGRVEILSGRKGTSLRLHEGVGAGARTGAAMASLGDLDGDGVEDYLIGSPGESTLGYKQGSVRLYSGATGAELQLLDGAAPGDEFGAGIAAGRDLDADGVADFIIGAPGSSLAAYEGGAVRAYSGATGVLLWEVAGDLPERRIGGVLAMVRDLNQDGYCDVLIGDPRGGAVSAFDLGVGHVQLRSGLDGQLLQLLEGDQEGDRFGSSLTDLGDLDLDGADEFAVGAPANQLGGASAQGYVRVFEGPPSASQLQLGILGRTAGQSTRVYVTGATPQSLVSVYGGRDAGYTPMPGGTHLDLAAPTMMASILTDSQGEASVDSWIGAAYAGTPVRLQAIDDQGNRSAPLYFVIQ